MGEKQIEQMGVENPFLRRIQNFGFSAVIATVIMIIGLLIGGHFVFGFGIFMLALIGFLTAIAVLEYVVSMV